MWELTILTDKRMSVIEKTFLPPVNITLFWHHLADQLSGTFRHREKGKVVWKLIFSLLAPQHQPPRLVPSHHDPKFPINQIFNQISTNNTSNSEWHKMWSRLAPQIFHFFRLITRNQDFCDKKVSYFNVSQQKVSYSSVS